MKKPIFVSLLFVSSSFLLSGCDVELVSVPQCPNPSQCEDEGSLIVYEKLQSVIVTMASGNPGKTNSVFNAANISIDYSSSSINITENSGYASIVLTLSNGSVASNAFPWSRVGQELVFSNPSAVNTWINPYLGQISEVEYDVNGLDVESHAGPNLFVSEVEYSNNIVDAGTASYYVPYGWCDPSTGICYDPE